MSKKKQLEWIGMSNPLAVLNGAKEINDRLEDYFPPERFSGHEEVLVMALVARVGVIQAKALLGAAG